MNTSIREILASFWGTAKRILPAYLPKHVDKFKQVRIRRFAGIASRGPNKPGWKRFYRTNYGHAALRDMRRKQRRQILKEWYRGQ